MESERRTRVEESARYLRGVRPIDPEEIATFVEGGAHPGVVREDLRELAPALGLIERDDGTFIPVPEEPVTVEWEPMRAVPERITRQILDLLVDRWGAGWPEGKSGDRLRSVIDELKAKYESGQGVTYNYDVALGYTVYHLPIHMAAATAVLHELGRDQLLDNQIRVLDVGAGVGSVGLALDEYLPSDALLEYTAIEPSEAIDVLTSLFDPTGRNVHQTLHRDRAETASVEGPFDLIIFSSVLSELTEPVATVDRYLEMLADDGSIALLTTGDRETSTALRSVERTLVDEREVATPYAPTVRFWPDHRPTDRGWSWTRDPDLTVPPFQDALDDGTNTYINTSVRYSFSLLRTDGRQRHDITLSRTEYVPMAESDSHVTNRVDMGCVILSPDLGSENPLYKISDGSESVDHYAVQVHNSELTRRLHESPYGTPLSLENVLLLWNEDESGYNVVVDDESVVEPL